eukprot:799781-Amphidinium_carterae.1
MQVGPAKPEWQLVVGKRACKGVCAELSSNAGRFPLQRVNRFAALDREVGFFSAESDVQPTSTANREAKQCSTGREAFLVHQNSFQRAPTGQELPGQHVHRVWFLTTPQRL